MERRPPLVAQRVNHRPCLAGERRNETVGRFQSPHAGETVAHDSVLFLQIVQHLRNRDYGFRRRQQAQGVTGRRRVDDDEVVIGRGSRRSRRRHRPRRWYVTGIDGAVRRSIGLDAGETRDFQQADQLVDSGQRQIEQGLHVAPIEPGTVLQHVSERPAVPVEPARERLSRVQFDGVKAAAPARCRAAGCRGTGARRRHLDRARR